MLFLFIPIRVKLWCKSVLRPNNLLELNKSADLYAWTHFHTKRFKKSVLIVSFLLIIKKNTYWVRGEKNKGGQEHFEKKKRTMHNILIEKAINPKSLERIKIKDPR